MAGEQLQPQFDCSCGRNHALPIQEIVVAPGAIARLAAAPGKLKLGTQALLVADRTTYEIAGREAERRLKEAGCNVKLCLFQTTEKLIPNESSLIGVLKEYTMETDFMVAVGSGTINDLVRYISSKVGCPYLSVPTAPSMDGYTSVVAPLIINGFKRPYEATYPLAVYAEPKILAAAPAQMIAAGFGDLMGKLTSRADWKLAQIIKGEYYCQSAVDLVQAAVDQCQINPERFILRDQTAISALTDGLINTGVAMLWVGNSRPASGAEHILAHFWEMKALLRGEFKHLHGSEVAVASVVIARVYQKIMNADLSRVDIDRISGLAADRGRWEEEVRRVYGPLAEGVFNENKDKTFVRETIKTEIEKIITTAKEWREAVRSFLPDPRKLAELLQRAGAPAFPADLELTPEQVREGILHCQKSRNRFTILDVAERLGLLEEIAAEIGDLK